MNKRVFDCSYGSNGAELSITKREYGDRLFMIVLSGDGFESHRDMTLDDMKDLYSWIGSAINATFKGDAT